MDLQYALTTFAAELADRSPRTPSIGRSTLRVTMDASGACREGSREDGSHLSYLQRLVVLRHVGSGARVPETFDRGRAGVL